MTMRMLVVWLGIVSLSLTVAVPAYLTTDAEAAPRSVRKEYREGMREIRRERKEMRRDILNSKSKAEARRAYREGMREIGRERREMRREIKREVRRRYVGRVVAGIALGSIVSVAAAGRAPVPPSPELCWFWSGDGRVRGYWYYCREDDYY